VGDVLSQVAVHDHSTAKPNSPRNTTPTAQNSKSANCSSRTSNLELRPQPLPAAETTHSSQKARLSHKLPRT
jgi:hypothetical protein